MAVCDILDLRCVIVNELIGSTILAILIGFIFYFIIAGKLKWGFDTTIALIVPVGLIFGVMFTGFSAIYAFATFFIGLLLAFVINVIIGNR